MPLNWHITEMVNPEIVKVYDEDGENWTLHHRTESLIFAMIAIGMGRITEDNAAEAFYRIRVMESVNGAFCYGPDPVPELAAKIAEAINPSNPEDYLDDIEGVLRDERAGDRRQRDAPFTMDDIINHIGFSCNVGYETREEWARRVIIGSGDGLHKYGDRLLDEEEAEAIQRKKEEQVERLYRESRYEDADELQREIDSFDVSMARDIVAEFRRHQAGVKS